jgi:hypothetical protein
MLAMDKFQRIGSRAAAAGIFGSLMLGFLKLAMDRLTPGSAQLQFSFEATCALLWPSAILLLGAQTSRGEFALFLLSACLNGGYFVFAVMFFVAVFDKQRRSRSHVLAPVAATRASVHCRKPEESVASSRSIA